MSDLQASPIKTVYKPGNSYAKRMGELADFRFSSIFIDLTNPNLFPAGGMGSSVFEMHGDWIYVDTSSVGAVEADLFKNQDDSMAVTLAPGRVFRQKFDQVRIFSTVASVPPTLPGGNCLANPGLTIFYGMGPCPFDSCDFEQSKQPVLYSTNFTAFGVALSSSLTIAVPQGASLTASIAGTQTTGAAETSLLRAWMVFSLPGGVFYKIAPDFSVQNDITVAAAGLASVQARWTKVKVPLGAFAVQFQVVNIGNAATNNIVQMASSANQLMEMG
jgi:hypothetical protein